MRVVLVALAWVAAFIALAGCATESRSVAVAGSTASPGSALPAAGAEASGTALPGPSAPEPTSAKGTPLTSWLGTYEFALPVSPTNASLLPTGVSRPVYTLRLDAEDGTVLRGRLVTADGGAGTPVTAAGTDKLAVTVAAAAPPAPVGLQDGRPFAFLDGDPQAPETCLATLATAVPDLPPCGRYFARVVG